MNRILAAMLAAASCATMAQAQVGPSAPVAQDAPVYTLDQAVSAAGGSAPAAEAATAGIDAARAGRTVAGLRPNPVVQGQVENVIGSGPYRGGRSAETTVGFAIPIELGGKRGARVAVANAQLSRAEIQAAIIAADVRLQVTQLYVEAVAADRRVMTARDQARIASDALRAASVRVQAGRASPLEQQRADVARINADANVERQLRLAEAARANLARRIGRPIDGLLDDTLLDRLPDVNVYGPLAPVNTTGTLALAAANADFSIAEAGVRLARAGRVRPAGAHHVLVLAGLVAGRRPRKRVRVRVPPFHRPHAFHRARAPAAPAAQPNLVHRVFAGAQNVRKRNLNIAVERVPVPPQEPALGDSFSGQTRFQVFGGGFGFSNATWYDKRRKGQLVVTRISGIGKGSGPVLHSMRDWKYCNPQYPGLE